MCREFSRLNLNKPRHRPTINTLHRHKRRQQWRNLHLPRDGSRMLNGVQSQLVHQMQSHLHPQIPTVEERAVVGTDVMVGGARRGIRLRVRTIRPLGPLHRVHHLLMCPHPAPLLLPNQMAMFKHKRKRIISGNLALLMMCVFIFSSRWSGLQY